MERAYLPRLWHVCVNIGRVGASGRGKGEPSAQRLVVLLKDTVLFSREALVVLGPDANWASPSGTWLSDTHIGKVASQGFHAQRS